jgi:hypothetical protein
MCNFGRSARTCRKCSAAEKKGKSPRHRIAGGQAGGGGLDGSGGSTRRYNAAKASQFLKKGCYKRVRQTVDLLSDRFSLDQLSWRVYRTVMKDRSATNYRQKVAAKIDLLSASDVRKWLVVRMEECRHLGQNVTGADRKAWMQDEAFFAAAIGLIDWTEVERTAAQ